LKNQDSRLLLLRGIGATLRNFVLCFTKNTLAGSCSPTRLDQFLGCAATSVSSNHEDFTCWRQLLSSSQHNLISSVVVVQSTLTGSTLPSSRGTRPTECLTNTFVFWSFSSLC